MFIFAAINLCLFCSGNKKEHSRFLSVFSAIDPCLFAVLCVLYSRRDMLLSISCVGEMSVSHRSTTFA